MSLPWPGFLRRRALLERSRAALLSGDLAQALELLTDRALRDDREAGELLARALERLSARASGAPESADAHTSDGGPASVSQEAASAARTRAEEALSLLARHAPERALALQRELVRREEPAPARPDGSQRLASLLDELRSRSRGARVEPRGIAADNPAPVTQSRGNPEREGEDAPRAQPEDVPAALFHLAVDDGGEFLAAVGPRLVIGHLRSRAADLPLLADIDAEHAELRASLSFHGGLRWRLVPLADEARRRAMSWRGRELAREGVELSHGDRVTLARNLALRVVAPDAASSSMILELEHGLECHGTTRILLFAPGPAGRVRLGRKRTRTIAISDLEHDVSLELQPGLLVVACPGGLRHEERVAAPAPDARLELEFPPPRDTCIVIGARTPPKPPFQITLRPLDLPDVTGLRGAPGSGR